VYFVFCCSGPDFHVPDELSGSVVVVLSVPLSIHVISLDLSVIFQSSVQVPPLFKVILGVFVMVILGVVVDVVVDGVVVGLLVTEQVLVSELLSDKSVEVTVSD
jgi:hypothetical protein